MNAKNNVLFSVSNYLIKENRLLEELIESRFKTFNQLWVINHHQRPIIEPVAICEPQSYIEIDNQEAEEMECIEYHTIEELLQKLQDMMYLNKKQDKVNESNKRVAIESRF